MFHFSKANLPKFIHRISSNVKHHKEKSKVPSKRKRPESQVMKSNLNDSMMSESSCTTKKVISNAPHKLRRTKKSENLREEWKKYHNNFIPVIPSNSSNTKENISVISTGIIKNINSKQSSYNYIGIKYSIKNNLDKNNYIKLADKLESKIKEHHIAKKRRLFSFIPL